MDSIINLRQARKARERERAERQAEASRLKHGRSKADKRLADVSMQRQNDVLDGARREILED